MLKQNFSGCIADPAYPGTPLRRGSVSSDVRLMQKYLNAINAECTCTDPPAPLEEDGMFGPATEAAVIRYQKMFCLVPDGVIGRITWDSIVCAYMALPADPQDYPGTPLRPGAKGEAVLLMQQTLNLLAAVYPAIPVQTEDGVFGASMSEAVRCFQLLFGLSADGVIGEGTWDAILAVQAAAAGGSAPAVTAVYAGLLQEGSTGDAVRLVQSWLNAANRDVLVIDGYYGPDTVCAVRMFQRTNGLAVDGTVGAQTWAALQKAFNGTL